jgi:hypothetical protein
MSLHLGLKGLNIKFSVLYLQRLKAKDTERQEVE